jgi:hypothetical protein
MSLECGEANLSYLIELGRVLDDKRGFGRIASKLKGREANTKARQLIPLPGWSQIPAKPGGCPANSERQSLPNIFKTETIHEMKRESLG